MTESATPDTALQRIQNLLTLHPLLRGGLLFGFGVLALAFRLFDLRYGWLFSSVTLSVAMICVVLWPLVLPSVTSWAACLSPVAWLVSMFAVHLVLPPWPSHSDIERSGARIVQQLEAYQSAHGTYPESLVTAGIRSPRYRCGSFEYSRETPHKFHLGIGDYMLDGFEVSWQPERKSWYWDT